MAPKPKMMNLSYDRIPDEDSDVLTDSSNRNENRNRLVVYSFLVIISAFLVVGVIVSILLSHFSKQLDNIGEHVKIIQTSIDGDQLHLMTVKGFADRGFSIDSIGFSNDNQCKLKVRNVDCSENIPTNSLVEIDTKIKYQEIIGFGGALTESTAYNFAQLDVDLQGELLELYFGKSGLRYNMGRLPINSCDFSLSSYNFDNKNDDYELSHFDTSVTRDQELIIPFILAALDTISSSSSSSSNLDTSSSSSSSSSSSRDAEKDRGIRGGQGYDQTSSSQIASSSVSDMDPNELLIIATPWSPPPWMKAPLAEHSTVKSDAPTPVPVQVPVQVPVTASQAPTVVSTSSSPQPPPSSLPSLAASLPPLSSAPLLSLAPSLGHTSPPPASNHSSSLVPVQVPASAAPFASIYPSLSLIPPHANGSKDVDHTWPGDDDASEADANASTAITASTATTRNGNRSLKEEEKKDREVKKQVESNLGHFKVISAGELSNKDDDTIKYTKAKMTGSNTPNGLRNDPRVLASWAKYFSLFIDSYELNQIPIWAVTPQNEPEYAAPWEACVYNASFERYFIDEYLGPLLHVNHPEVKILAFDHNKDHLLDWAKVMYLDTLSDTVTKTSDNQQSKNVDSIHVGEKEHILIDGNKVVHAPQNSNASHTNDDIFNAVVGSPYVDGMAFHWYTNGNDRKLDGTYGYDTVNETYFLNPSKILLATESSNCPDVRLGDWTLAERYGHDMMYNILNYCQGYMDWNLLLDENGGPNHLNNYCDAPVIVTTSYDALIVQPKYYVIGHFSRHVMRGSVRVSVNVVGDYNFINSDPNVHSGVELGMYYCERSSRQTWHIEDFPVSETSAPYSSTKAGKTAYHPIRLNASSIQKDEMMSNFDMSSSSSSWADSGPIESSGVLRNMCISSGDSNRPYLRVYLCSDVMTTMKHDDSNDNNNDNSAFNKFINEDFRILQIKVLKIQNSNSVFLVDAATNLCVTTVSDKLSSLLILSHCDHNNLYQIFSFDPDTLEISSINTNSNTNDRLCLTAGWPMLSAVGFQTPLNEIVIILMNENSVSTYVELSDVDRGSIWTGVNGHAIQTIVYDV